MNPTIHSFPHFSTLTGSHSLPSDLSNRKVRVLPNYFTPTGVNQGKFFEMVWARTYKITNNLRRSVVTQIEGIRLMIILLLLKSY